MMSRSHLSTRTIIWWGVGLFLLINAFSWSPGYGDRRDGWPGMEVERFFGWPACLRAEFWRSARPHEVNILAYMPPVPLSQEMSIVYAVNSISAFLVNVTLAVCGIVTFIVLVKVEKHPQQPRWMFLAIVAAISAAFLCFWVADSTSAYL